MRWRSSRWAPGAVAMRFPAHRCALGAPPQGGAAQGRASLLLHSTTARAAPRITARHRGAPGFVLSENPARLCTFGKRTCLQPYSQEGLLTVVDNKARMQLIKLKHQQKLFTQKFFQSTFYFNTEAF